MPDPLTRAKKYMERADECIRLSNLAGSPELKAEYERLADQYQHLAEGEVKFAEEQAAFRARVENDLKG
jgi:hypothetical protein